MPVTVEIFTAPDCPRCARAAGVLQSVCHDRLKWRVVNVLDDIDRAVALGGLTTPAIAIDGGLAFTSLPGEKVLQKTLMERISGYPRSDIAPKSGKRSNE
jgi:glutaredoxin